MAKIGTNGINIYGVPVECISRENDFYKRYYLGEWTTNERKKEKLPKRYIINKGATILFWDEDEEEKTIVKRSKDDKFNKRLGFLTAYFQYHSGLSKTQANKYLDSLEVEKEK